MLLLYLLSLDWFNLFLNQIKLNIVDETSQFFHTCFFAYLIIYIYIYIVSNALMECVLLELNDSLDCRSCSSINKIVYAKTMIV